MTRAQDTAHRFRWLLLVAGVLLFLLGVWALFSFWPVGELGEWSAGVAGTPGMIPWLEPFEAPGFYINGAIWLGIVLIMQWLFLRPRLGWAPRLASTGRPMKTSVIAAAFVAMLITIGLVATLLELPDWWDWVFEGKGERRYYGLWAVCGLVWAGWAVVFFCYWRQGDRYTQMGRMIRGLLAGSLLETLIAAPVQAYAAHRDDCYCARGSYTGLVFGLTAALWCFGPGLALLFLREHYRRAKLVAGEGGPCPKCGYDLRGTVAAGREACPECGEAIGTSSK